MFLSLAIRRGGHSASEGPANRTWKETSRASVVCNVLENTEYKIPYSMLSMTFGVLGEAIAQYKDGHRWFRCAPN